jgi:hypothetical protein
VVRLPTDLLVRDVAAPWAIVRRAHDPRPLGRCCLPSHTTITLIAALTPFLCGSCPRLPPRRYIRFHDPSFLRSNSNSRSPLSVVVFV